MSEATPYSPVTLDAVGEATDWFDLATLPEGAMFIGKVTGTVTYVFEISNDERTTGTLRADGAVAVATYTADVAKTLDGPGMPRYGRFRLTAGTGSVAVSWGKAKNWAGKLSEVNATSRHE